MKTLLVKFGLWLAHLGGWSAPVAIPVIEKCAREHVTPDMRFLRVTDAALTSAQMLTAQVEEKFPGQTGEFKRAQALRALLNVGLSEREAADAIQVALH